MPNETQNTQQQPNPAAQGSTPPASPQAPMKFDCPHCGSRVNARKVNGTMTCPNCRSKLSEADAVVPAAQLPESVLKNQIQSENKGAAISKVIIFAVILCIIVIALVFFLK